MTRPGLMPNGNPGPGAKFPEPPAETDPRKLSVEQLNGLGHVKRPLLHVIRTNCVECCAGNEAEVRRCGMHWCPFWPYRMAVNPFASEGRKEAARKMTRARVQATYNVANPTEGPSDE